MLSRVGKVRGAGRGSPYRIPRRSLLRNHLLARGGSTDLATHAQASGRQPSGYEARQRNVKTKAICAGSKDSDRRIGDNTLTLVSCNSMLVGISAFFILMQVAFLSSHWVVFRNSVSLRCQVRLRRTIAGWIRPSISSFKRHVGAVLLFSRRECPC